MGNCSCFGGKLIAHEEIETLRLLESPVGKHFQQYSAQMNPTLKQVFETILRGQARRIHSLSISNSKLQDIDYRGLCLALSELGHLGELQLTNNSLGVNGVRALVSSSSRLDSLTRLVLTDNPFGDSGLDVLCLSLEYMENLQCLDLSSNALTPKCLPAPTNSLNTSAACTAST